MKAINVETDSGSFQLGPNEGLAPPEEATPQAYPEFGMIPPSVLFSLMPVPETKLSPELASIRCSRRNWNDEESMKLVNFIFEWNMLWEAGQIRQSFFESEIPSQLDWLRSCSDQANLYLLPDYGGPKYDFYAPLFHLLPRRTVEQFGLPVLKRGHLPIAETLWYIDRHFKPDFNEKLSQAFAHHMWSLMDNRSRPAHFSATEPLMILSHNLNYWLPWAYKVIEERMRSWGRVPLDAKHKRRYRRLKGEVPAGVSVETPCYGGAVWRGEDEAWSAAEDIVAAADHSGQLRGIIDAVRSNRVEDDFSNLWSYQREDFERKLYRKRSKVKVTFVQLDDTIPMHGPTSEVHDNLMWEDFETLLDLKERRITVLLRNGLTKVGEISHALGYANHSPVSKTLAKIRKKAAAYLDLN